MVDNTARYVYEVYRLKSVSNAANALYVSQPAISAAIRKAEKDFGSPIFNRKTLPFTLTEEGKIYIDAVEKMLQIEDLASGQLQDLKEIRQGTLRIASGDPLSFRLISVFLKQFHQKHPQVDVHVMGIDADKVLEMLEKDLADIVFTPLESAQTAFPSVALFSQRSVVVLPENTPICPQLRAFALTREEVLSGRLPAEKLVTDLSLFRDVKFLHIASIPYITKRRAALFDKFEVAAHITSSTSRTYMNYNLMRAGFGALLTTDAQLTVIPPEPGCLFFPLGGPQALQNYSVIYSLKNRPHSQAPLQSFLETAQELFNCENSLEKLT